MKILFCPLVSDFLPIGPSGAATRAYDREFLWLRCKRHRSQGISKSFPGRMQKETGTTAAAMVPVN